MYLLDANVFITAKNAHYGMDFAPGFWEWIERAHGAGTAFTVEKVYEELKDGGDQLATWIKAQPTAFRKKVDQATVAELGKLTAWAAASQHYSAGAVSTFLSSADYYLVGQAAALGATVVTHEQPAPMAKNIVKIPDACQAIGVPCVLPWKMLRDERARLVV